MVAPRKVEVHPIRYHAALGACCHAPRVALGARCHAAVYVNPRGAGIWVFKKGRGARACARVSSARADQAVPRGVEVV
eukprot:gene11624-biopygen4874